MTDFLNFPRIFLEISSKIHRIIFGGRDKIQYGPRHYGLWRKIYLFIANKCHTQIGHGLQRHCGRWVTWRRQKDEVSRWHLDRTDIWYTHIITSWIRRNYYSSEGEAVEVFSVWFFPEILQNHLYYLHHVTKLKIIETDYLKVSLILYLFILSSFNFLLNFLHYMAWR